MKKLTYISVCFVLVSIILSNTFPSLTFAEVSTTLSTTQNTTTTSSYKSETEKEKTETTTATTTRYETYHADDPISSTNSYTTTQEYQFEEDSHNSNEIDDEVEKDDLIEDLEQDNWYYENTTTYYKSSYAGFIDTTHKTTQSTATTQTTTNTTVANTEIPSESIFSSISIPKLLGTGVEISGINTNIVGITAWGVIGVALIIVLIIIFRNKKRTSRGTSIGRNRYKRNPSRSKDKHLLSDKYYSSKYKRGP